MVDHTQKMQITKSGKFITLITAKENTANLLDELVNRFGINRFMYNSARGLTVVNSRLIGKFYYVEKVIITIIADEEIADRVFEFLYNYLDIINKPGSFMYMGDVKDITEYRLPG